MVKQLSSTTISQWRTRLLLQLQGARILIMTVNTRKQAKTRAMAPIGQVETVESAGQIVRADGTSWNPIYQDTVVTADGSTAGVIFAENRYLQT